jgi:hypothetical protein
MNSMAATTTTGFSIPMSAPAVSTICADANGRRSISPEAGHALLILDHAIDYLTNEFLREGRMFSTEDAQLQAVHLLMDVNRRIYYECPQLPPLKKRFLAFLYPHAD